MDFFLHSPVSCIISVFICQDVETLKNKAYQQTKAASLDETQEKTIGSMGSGCHGMVDTAHNFKTYLNDHMCMLPTITVPKSFRMKIR